MGAPAWQLALAPPRREKRAENDEDDDKKRVPHSRGSGSAGCGKARARRSGGSGAQLQPAQRHPLALGVMVATSLYCGVKAGIQGYQHLRRRNLRHLVRTVVPVLDALDVTYWADFGTLLGMHREHDIILHDNDADLVVLNPDWDYLLSALRAALPPGLRVFIVVPSEDRSIRWLRVMSGVGIMDLYGGFIETSSDGAGAVAAATAATKTASALPTGNGCAPSLLPPPEAHVSIPQGHGNLCDVPASLVFPLSVIKFRGVGVSVPGDVPGVLRWRYGEDYMVPRYMDKGRDCVEQGKLYARLLGALGKAGLRV